MQKKSYEEPSEEPRQPLPKLPITAEMIGAINDGSYVRPAILTSVNRRKIEYLAENYTGCLVLVVVQGKLKKDDIYRVQRINLGPVVDELS